MARPTIKWVLKNLADEWPCLSLSERVERVAGIVQEWGISQRSVYRHLKGLITRSSRADNGSPRSVGIDTLFRVAAVKLRSMNTKGISVSTEQAAEELVFQGKLTADLISDRASMDAWMRRFGISKKHMRRPRPSVRLIGAHPNAWHVADFSPSQAFYLDNMGKPIYLGGTKNYKARHTKGKKRLIIGGIKDAYAKVGFFWAFEARGENAESAIKFLYEAWIEKEDHGFPWHGLPNVLYTDPGGAWRAKPVQNLLRRLGVKHQAHLPGAARSTGLIERAFLETARFEALLKTRLSGGWQPSLEQFNRWLYERTVTMNAKPHPDFRSKARNQAWLEILDEQLRRCPPWEVFRTLTAEGERRKVNQYMAISLDGYPYYLGIPDLVGEEVLVFRDAEERVFVETQDGEVRGPLEKGMKHQVLGEEVKVPGLASWEKNIREVRRIARGMGYKELDKEVYEREDDLLYAQRKGQDVKVDSPILSAETEDFRTLMAAKLYMADRLGISLAALSDDLLGLIDQFLDDKRDAGAIPRIAVEDLIDKMGIVVARHRKAAEG